jgi:flagellin-like protein
MENKKRSLEKDEEAASPVVGVVMMIAITVIIATIVTAFAYSTLSVL